MKIYDFGIKLRELIEMLEQEKELTPILKEIKELLLKADKKVDDYVHGGNALDKVIEYFSNNV